MTELQKKLDLKKVVSRRIKALKEKRKAVTARKYILSVSKPEEFIAKKTLFGPAVSPLERNISYAGIKKDLLVADCDLEINDIDSELDSRDVQLQSINEAIEDLKEQESKDGKDE